jgi:PAS domain S-box-containing protein
MEKKIKKQTSINKEIVLLTVVIVAITSVIFGSVTLIIVRKSLINHINKKAELKTEKINAMVSGPVLNGDYQKLTCIINEEMKTSDLRFAWITDKNGNIIATNDGNQISSVIKDEYKNCTGFINYKNATGGAICVLPDYGIIETVTARLIPWIFISLIISSAFVYGISFNFRKKITMHIRKAARASDAMSKGDFNINLTEPGIEEIDHLYRTLTHTAGTLLDVTDHLQKEKNELNYSREAIRNLSEFRESIIDNASIWIEVLDKDSLVVVWNKAAEEISGFRKDEVIGNPAIWGLLYPDEKYRNSILQRNSGIIKKGDTIEDMITVIRAKDGNEKIISWYSKNLTTEDGTPTGSVAMGIDITEKIRAEESLKQAQKMETIGILAGGIAHDFNNILMGIVGTLSLLEFKLSGNEPLTKESAAKYITTIQNSAERAKNLVNQLLTLSRKQKLEMANIDIITAVKHVVEICRGSFDKSIIIIPPENSVPAYVRADLSQIEQVILNFCINALHSMTLMKPENEKWGGTLTITLELNDNIKNIFSDGHTDGKFWKISVQDTGVGMSKSVMRKIFDPFYTTKEKGTGTGLGLSIAYSIVKSHNGFINVRSEPGEGSIFEIYLPALEEGFIHEILTEDFVIDKGSGLILLVDDEKVNRDVARMMLEHCGYDVIIASDGEEAVRIYGENSDKIRAVILDIVMPSMSGDEACVRILKDYPDAAILVSSGFRNDPRVKRSITAGAKLFIPKPYTLKILSEALSQINSPGSA